MAGFPQWVGNYQLERQIGRGGMSQVWLARHRTLSERTVAVKLLVAPDQEWEDRFAREASITSRLHHESVIQIYDHGYIAPYHYTIMEYIAGGSLRDLLRSRGALPLDTTLMIARRAAQALDYAHAQGVVHRDISPGNLLLDTANGRVVLSDFGIAREAGKPLHTAVHKVMGTPGYLSPEHAASATAVTHLSDIYALGLVLYEMLCGKLPWDYSPGIPDASGGPFTAPPPLKSRGAASLPPDADRVVQTMLALDPAKRYPSATAAIDELDRALKRHHSATRVIDGKAQRASTTSVASDVDDLLSFPVEPHPVERALAIDLIKAPMQRTLKHAEALANRETIAGLLNAWSEKGMRQRLLGRRAMVRRVTCANVYFYTLQVLYETRDPPKTIEEPDSKAITPKLEREVDRWGVELPPPRSFADDPGGSLRLSGSLRVLGCETCKGIGRTVCKECKGAGRVTETREVPAISAAASQTRAAAAPRTAAAGAAVPTVEVVVSCKGCGGAGYRRCDRCAATGRVVQQKTIAWLRFSREEKANDDLPNVDESWLHQACDETEVYSERQVGGFRPEWAHVPELAALIKNAEQQTNADTRVALSNVSISLIPVAEIFFDLGGNAENGQPKIYTSYIYGFERQLPGDQRFLNWDRIIAIALAAVVVLAIVIAIALAALAR